MKLPIIIVEDELPIREMLRFSLEKEGYHLLEAENYYELKKLMQQVTPSLILLDWMLPYVSGLEIIQKLKEKADTRPIPIIMLTAKAEENNKIIGLQGGADDYIVKPFSPRELVARIQAVLRRGQINKALLKAGNLVLNTESGELFIADKKVKLTALEFRLLALFLANKNRIFTREQLLDRVWGNDKEITDRTVDVQIRRLRKLLENYHQAHLIETVYGMGYKLVDTF